MFDVSSDPPLLTKQAPLTKPEEQCPPEKTEQKKFIGVRFNCCNVYVRIYINKEGTGYEGRCPKCYRPVKFKIGTGGTDNRFFEAY